MQAPNDRLQKLRPPKGAGPKAQKFAHYSIDSSTQFTLFIQNDSMTSTQLHALSIYLLWEDAVRQDNALVAASEWAQNY